jgi:hypothetical protein
MGPFVSSNEDAGLRKSGVVPGGVELISFG